MIPSYSYQNYPTYSEEINRINIDAYWIQNKLITSIVD